MNGRPCPRSGLEAAEVHGTRPVEPDFSSRGNRHLDQVVLADWHYVFPTGLLSGVWAGWGPRDLTFRQRTNATAMNAMPGPDQTQQDRRV